MAKCLAFIGVQDLSWTNFSIICLLCLFALNGFADDTKPSLDVPYETTHPEVVRAMLTLAKANKNDVHFDLGCGDGRLVIAAVKDFGVRRGVGVDIDPQRIKEARFYADGYGISDKTSFILENINNIDIRNASIITMYLLNKINFKIRPRILMELKPGTRIVSHAFHMDDWAADETVVHLKARRHTIYKWIIPAHVGGVWKWDTTIENLKQSYQLELSQQFQVVNGILKEVGNTLDFQVNKVELNGQTIAFSASTTVRGQKTKILFMGIVQGNTIKGTQVWDTGPYAGKHPWVAKRGKLALVDDWTVAVMMDGADYGNRKLRNTLVKVKKDKRKKIPTSGDSDEFNECSFQQGGKLHIWKNELGKYSAYYYQSGSSDSKRISDIYLWGSSLYFRLPCNRGNTKYIVFTGQLNNYSGTGVATVITTNPKIRPTYSVVYQR